MKAAAADAAAATTQVTHVVGVAVRKLRYTIFAVVRFLMESDDC